MQRGTIIKHRKSWTLLYYDHRIRGGQRIKVRVSKKLAAVSKEYPTESSVRTLAAKILSPINEKRLLPESSLKLCEFIEQHYFPMVKRELRPSTYKGYKEFVYEAHLKTRLEKLNLRVRDFRTVHGQRLLREIPDVGHRTLLHMKNFLSGIFKFAKREGVLDGLNPMVDVSVPGRPKKFKGVAYTIEDAEAFVERIDSAVQGYISLKDAQTAVDVIVLLSLTGLRQSECRGLRWSDWDESSQTLQISRAVWGRHVNATKNPESENSIPVIPLLQDLLKNRRERIKPKPGDYIFAGEKRGAPLNLHNLENRVIKVAFEKTRMLGSEDSVYWKGFHGFRRGLATNLLALGVNPPVIAAILRHSDVATTLEFYAQTRSNETRIAMEQLENRIRNRPSGVLIGGREV
jgi:integrase